MKTLSEFIAKANVRHWDENMDYSQTKFIDDNTKVKIICKDLDWDDNEYGDFLIEPKQFLKGYSHPKKGNEPRKKNLVCKDYLNLIGIETISCRYHIGKLKVKEILKNNNVKLRDKNKPKNKQEFVINDFRIEKYVEEEGFHYVAIAKDKSIKFNDYMNKGGFLTSFIKEKYGIATPTLYERRKFYQTTGNYWWEQWFDIVKEENKPVKKCPYCEWTTIDIKNKSGVFLTHLLKKHRIEKEKHLSLHPEDRQFLTLANKSLDRKTETNDNNFVVCAICGQKFGCIDCRHLNKHNISKTEYIKLYGNNLISKSTHDKLSKITITNNINKKPTWVSKPELEIRNFLEENGVEYIGNDRKILGGKELDFYIPKQNLAIEYNGLFWHTEGMNNKTKYSHLEKLEQCKKRGIKLIQIFEDEYVNKKEIVLNKLKHILNIKNNGGIKKIDGRKTKIKEIDKITAKQFLNSYHIQGFGRGSVYLGAFFENELIAVMSLKKIKKFGDDWELNRVASNYNYLCRGVVGKIFNFFIKNFNPSYVKSFADRRWTINEENNLYIQLGFSFEEYTPPDYSYYSSKIDKYNRLHKFGFRKKILNKKYDFPLEMTEREMVEKLGCIKIWNCGLIKYIWKK